MAGTKRAIPESTRRAVATRYGCEPGTVLVGVKCHWCTATGSIVWHRLKSGEPSLWVSFPALELDHVIPEARGGTAEPSNIVLSCRTCNRSRGSRLPHKTLTEHVVSDSPPTHPRKGREGKGREKESWGVAPIHRHLGERASAMDGRASSAVIR